MMVIDADGLIIGRLATVVAKSLLMGERVIIINAEKAVVVGNRDFILHNYMKRRRRGSVRKGPFYPKMADRILRRTVRGMLPMKTAHGRESYKRLMVYMGIPEDLKNAKKSTITIAKNNKLKGFVTLKEISNFLGAKI